MERNIAFMQDLVTMMKASAAVHGHDIISPPPVEGTEIPVFPGEHRLLGFGLRPSSDVE